MSPFHPRNSEALSRGVLQDASVCDVTREATSGAQQAFLQWKMSPHLPTFAIVGRQAEAPCKFKMPLLVSQRLREGPGHSTGRWEKPGGMCVACGPCAAHRWARWGPVPSPSEDGGGGTSGTLSRRQAVHPFQVLGIQAWTERPGPQCAMYVFLP